MIVRTCAIVQYLSVAHKVFWWHTLCRKEGSCFETAPYRKAEQGRSDGNVSHGDDHNLSMQLSTVSLNVSIIMTVAQRTLMVSATVLGGYWQTWLLAVTSLA